MLIARRLLVLALVLAACAGGSEPIDPVWGKQACESCRMLVSDPAYAAQLVDDRGRRHLFDDVGCLDAFLVEHPNLKPRALWVRAGARWVEAQSARYAAGAPSPMAYGFVAGEGGPLDFTAVRRGAAAHRKELSR
jgi:copper chaperone NosL